jgi:hypothetical protein
MGARGPRCLYQ